MTNIELIRRYEEALPEVKQAVDNILNGEYSGKDVRYLYAGYREIAGEDTARIEGIQVIGQVNAEDAREIVKTLVLSEMRVHGNMWFAYFLVGIEHIADFLEKNGFDADLSEWRA